MTGVQRFPARILATLGLALLVLVGLPAPRAHAFDGVGSYVAEGVVAPDGTLTVRATLQPEGAPGEIVQRLATRMATLDDREYRFSLSDIRVTVSGADAGARVTDDGSYRVVSIPIAAGSGPVVLEYTVRGAALATDGTTTLTWRFLQGLSVPVRDFEATLSVPGLFTMIDCAAGPPGNPGACGSYAGGTHDEPDPIFRDGPRGAGEVVQIVARFPTAVVAPNEDVVTLWTLDRAFSTDPLPLGVAGGLAALGALVLYGLHRCFGVDAQVKAEPAVIARFHPVGAGQSQFQVVDEVRPGQVGTLVDERVDPIDVTATLIDLAVRGHLLITELPHETAFKRADWVLSRREAGADLRPYESSLLEAVAPVGGAGVRVSELAPAVAAVIDRVQGELYDDVVAHGWFARRPDETRGLWTRLGWLALAVALVAAGLLIAFTTFGLAGLVLVALAVGVGVVGQAMPARTHAGAAVLAGLGVLRGQLLTQPTDQGTREHAYAELSGVLPFAVVLGGLERWLDGVAAADGDDDADSRDLTWYHGPDDWHLADFPDSLRNFVTTTEGTLFGR